MVDIINVFRTKASMEREIIRLKTELEAERLRREIAESKGDRYETKLRRVEQAGTLHTA